MTDEYALRLAEQWSKGQLCTLKPNYMIEDYHKACATALREKLERDRSEVLESGWIGVNERVPDLYDAVLIYDKHENLLIGCRVRNGWCSDGLYEYDSHYATYWMPLPEPPGA